MTGVSYQRVTFYACCQVCKGRSLYCRNGRVMAYIQRPPSPAAAAVGVVAEAGAGDDVTFLLPLVIGRVEIRVEYGGRTQWLHPPNSLIRSATLETS